MWGLVCERAGSSVGAMVPFPHCRPPPPTARIDVRGSWGPCSRALRTLRRLYTPSRMRSGARGPHALMGQGGGGLTVGESTPGFENDRGRHPPPPPGPRIGGVCPLGTDTLPSGPGLLWYSVSTPPRAQFSTHQGTGGVGHREGTEEVPDDRSERHRSRHEHCDFVKLMARWVCDSPQCATRGDRRGNPEQRTQPNVRQAKDKACVLAGHAGTGGEPAWGLGAWPVGAT